MLVARQTCMVAYTNLNWVMAATVTEPSQAFLTLELVDRTKR